MDCVGSSVDENILVLKATYSYGVAIYGSIEKLSTYAENYFSVLISFTGYVFGNFFYWFLSPYKWEYYSHFGVLDARICASRAFHGSWGYFLLFFRCAHFFYFGDYLII